MFLAICNGCAFPKISWRRLLIWNNLAGSVKDFLFIISSAGANISSSLAESKTGDREESRFSLAIAIFFMWIVRWRYGVCVV